MKDEKLLAFVTVIVEETGYETRQTSKDYVFVRFYDLSRDIDRAQT